MKIKKIIRQHRRDFTAIYICEHCKEEEEKGGYDDSNFHVNVVPGMICKNCKKSAGDCYEARAPKYPENEVV
jgi:hypothetical protein